MAMVDGRAMDRPQARERLAGGGVVFCDECCDGATLMSRDTARSSRRRRGRCLAAFDFDDATINSK